MLTQQLVNAISLGGVYALFALGFTLVFGVLGVVNLAHGALFMLGAYAALQAVLIFQLPLLAAIVVAMLVTAAGGWLLDKFIFAPLRARQAPHLAPMIATIGLAIALNSTIQGLFGAQNLRFPAEVLPYGKIALGRRSHHLARSRNNCSGDCFDGSFALGTEKNSGRPGAAGSGRVGQSRGAGRRRC